MYGHISRIQLPRWYFLPLTPSSLFIVFVVRWNGGTAAAIVVETVVGVGNHLHNAVDDNDGGSGGGDIALVHCLCLFDSFVLMWISFSHYYFTNMLKCSVYICCLCLLLCLFLYIVSAAAERRKNLYTHTHMNQKENKCVMCAWFCNK